MIDTRQDNNMPRQRSSTMIPHLNRLGRVDMSPTKLSHVVPILVLLDVEPDGFFIDRDKPDPWRGFEIAVDTLSDFRTELERRTGGPVHFSWCVRADPQIAETYGEAGWAFEVYRDKWRRLQAGGDEIGVHIHAYRWLPDSGQWLEDYANQTWVEICMATAVEAFERFKGHRPAVFGMGADWTNTALVHFAERLGLAFDVTPIAGKPASRWPALGSYTGVLPDCSKLPQRPYRPSVGDFRVADPERTEGLWIIPQATNQFLPPGYSIWRRRERRAHVKKLFLSEAPSRVAAQLNRALEFDTPRYLTLVAGTRAFAHNRRLNAIRDNLKQLASHPESERLALMTPPELVAKMLEPTV